MMENKLTALQRIGFGKSILIFLIGALIVSVCILSWVPPVSRDALTHHLVVPKIYLEKGGIVEIKGIGASYFPQNLDLLYVIPLYFGNDIVPKYIHFAFALLTAWLIFGYLKKRLDSIHALFGVLLFLTLPVIVKLSFTVYVDLGLIFFSTASLLLLFKWVEDEFRYRYLILSAVCCGLALGTKYNGLIGFLILTLFVPFLYNRQSPPGRSRQFRAVGVGLLFFAVSLMVFSPWMIRNAVWKGNPLHPLFPGVFNIKKPVAESVGSQPKVRQPNTDKRLARNKASPLWIRKNIFDEPWWQIALIPVRIFFEGRDDDPRTFDGRLNPMLFFLPMFAFRRFRDNSLGLKTEKKLLLTFAVLFFLYAFFQVDMRIRYISPIIPPLVILSAFGLQEIQSAVRERFSSRNAQLALISVWVLITAAFAGNAVYIAEQFAKYRPLDYISGRVDRDEYITRHRPEYPVLQYANRNTAENSKLLCLFQGYRRYYIDRVTIHSEKLLHRIVVQAKSPQGIARRLHKRKYTHLLMHFDLFETWAINIFSDMELKRLNTFFSQHTRVLTTNGGYILMELIPVTDSSG